MKATNETRLRNYWKLGFGLATLVLLCLKTGIAQTTYTVTDLGTLGGTFGLAHDVNNRGQVSGLANVPGDTTQHAFFWQKGVMTDLGTLGGPNSKAFFGPNERGQVEGQADIASGTRNPFVCFDFGPSPPSPSCHAFLWQKGVGMTDLGTLPGDPDSFACNINDQGQVVGFTDTRAFLWQNGKMTDLNTLIPANSDYFLVFAGGINSRGDIAGNALQKSTGQIHAIFGDPHEWE